MERRLNIYLKMKQEDRDTLKRERTAYQQRQGQGRSNRNDIAELRSQIQELISVSSNRSPTDSVSVSGISQVTTGNSIMGGRNEQAANRQSRQVRAVVTKRLIRASNPQSKNEAPPNTAADNECDTNADTCCLGKNFVILHYSYRTADVYAYDSSIKPVKNVPIVTGATAYDDAQSGDTFILVFHESLF